MNSEHIAAFLRLIPQSNQDAVPISELTNETDCDILLGYALMLQTIGIVQIDLTGKIKATSQTAHYTLHSIASYAENDLRWIDDWKTRGVHRQDNGFLQNGATFLHELESRRLAALEKPAPSRSEEVVQVFIKRSNPDTGEAEFLMQYDANADQYQLIGGRRSPDDESLEIAIIREIEEEVSNTLVYGRDYQLDVILPDMAVAPTLSPTFGAFTEYHFTVYHMTDLKQAIELQDGDAWVALDSVLSGVVDANGKQVIASDNSLYQQMDRAIKGGLGNLPDSFSI